MPQFDFYITDREREELIHFLLEKNTIIVPDLLYKSEAYTVLNSLDEFRDLIVKKHNKFFLLHQFYTKEPIINSKNIFFETPTYSIYQRKGGPYIDLTFYLGYAKEATMPYKRSVLDYYAKFIHFNDHKEFRATDDLKTFYKDIVKFIKQKCTATEYQNKIFWVSNDIKNFKDETN